MAVINNWRGVLRRAWSVRLILLAATLSGLEVIFQVAIAFAVMPAFLPAGVFAALAGLVTLAAFIARFMAQGL